MKDATPVEPEKPTTPVEPEKPTTPENKPSTDTTNKTDTTKKDPVKTGDTTTFAAYIAMLAVAAFGIILTRRKRA